MKINKKNKFSFYIASLALLFGIGLFSCGGNTAKNEEAALVDDEAFYETQPVHSGFYDADYYDIEGTNSRKGRFDGRVYISLSPSLSALYVFENGNRTKIEYLVGLQKPFEKGDSGIYRSVDTNNRPVTISTDSTMYVLNFQKPSEDIKITFNPKPRHVGSAVEIQNKILEKTKKNN